MYSLPGMGAVSTTVIAGVELIKKGLGRPIGSLTQYGTIRLGKRTDHNSPLIKDFVPQPGLTIWSLAAGTFLRTAATKPPCMPGSLNRHG